MRDAQEDGMRSQYPVQIRRGEPEWRRLVARFEASRLDAVSFCERESISLSSLQRWRRRLREADQDGFVEIPVPGLTTSASQWSLEVELPNGVVLRLRG